jgi:hypothetical protein
VIALVVLPEVTCPGALVPDVSALGANAIELADVGRPAA